ncbi:MAG: HAD-IA family hydrolase, partial [Aestuariivirga sp.]
VKPEPDIFHLLASRNNIKLSDSIFIDDSAKNIKGAEAVGMQTHHFKTPEGLRADLKRRNLL